MSDITREEDIVKSIKEMGYDRTPYDRREVGRVISKAIKALENQKTGHWIVYSELTGEWEGTKKYACDKCGVKVGVFKSNFCPNCGAKMEGEKE